MINDDVELDLENIFSKHLIKNYIVKPICKFGKETINKNKKELELLRENNVIKEKIHFCIDDKEIDDDEMQIDEEMNNNIPKNDKKKDKYFNNLVKETLKHEGLYCSYLDQFDKIWLNNNVKNTNNKNMLSCVGCFNEVCLESFQIKNFNNVYLADKLINTFDDYCNILSGQDFLKILKENISHMNNISEKQILSLGIDLSIDKPLQYISTKCNNCYNVIAVYDSFNKKYIIFNAV